MKDQTASKSIFFHWSTLGFFLTALVTICFVALHATPYMLAATISYSFLVLGLLLRQNIKAHPWFMLSAIILDLGLVLTLEFQRSAIKTAASFTLSPLQQAHIGTSTLATALYIPVLYLGFRRWRGSLADPASKMWHIRLGIAAFIFRTAGFLLMFTLLSYVTKTS